MSDTDDFFEIDYRSVEGVRDSYAGKTPDQICKCLQVKGDPECNAPLSHIYFIITFGKPDVLQAALAPLSAAQRAEVLLINDGMDGQDGTVMGRLAFMAVMGDREKASASLKVIVEGFLDLPEEGGMEVFKAMMDKLRQSGQDTETYNTIADMMCELYPQPAEEKLQGSILRAVAARQTAPASRHDSYPGPR